MINISNAVAINIGENSNWELREKCATWCFKHLGTTGILKGTREFHVYHIYNGKWMADLGFTRFFFIDEEDAIMFRLSC